MDHGDHVGLLRGGVLRGGGVWADIGAGRGAFTLALADLLGPGARIVAVDRDEGALIEAQRSVEARFPGVSVEPLVADIGRTLELPALDGIVAANSLHFLPRPDRMRAVQRLTGHLRDAGRFLVVEYDTDAGNRWVPHPFSFETWSREAPAASLGPPELLGRVPSQWLGAIYSAGSAVAGRAGSTAAG